MRTQGSEGAIHEDIWEKKDPNKRDRKCEGFEIVVSRVSLRNSKEANVARTKRGRRRTLEDKVREIRRVRLYRS